jgi:hypothetical protein
MSYHLDYNEAKFKSKYTAQCLKPQVRFLFVSRMSYFSGKGDMRVLLDAGKIQGIESLRICLLD